MNLDKRVILRSPVTTADANGWVDPVARTNVATVYAKVRPLTGREMQRSGERQSEQTHEITIRYSDQIAIDTTWDVLYGARVFKIESAQNVNESNEWFVLACVEQTAPA